MSIAIAIEIAIAIDIVIVTVIVITRAVSGWGGVRRGGGTYLAAGGFLAGVHFAVKPVTGHDKARTCFAALNLNVSKSPSDPGEFVFSE